MNPHVLVSDPSTDTILLILGAVLVAGTIGWLILWRKAKGYFFDQPQAVSARDVESDSTE